MKRALFVLLALCITVGALATTKELPGQVRDVIERAIAGERAAIARYETFAAKAVEEGYVGAAALFRAQAQAERTHAERFGSLLQARGLSIPPEESVSSKSGSTEENLRAAFYAEMAERDGTYREAIETCNKNGAAEIAKVFDQTRDSEVEHANLCNAASRNPSSMKEPRTFYLCAKCGYTTDVKLAYCPSCQHKHPLAAVD